MKRVGFLINFNIFKWFGGTYLIKNLINCIIKYSKKQLYCYIFRIIKYGYEKSPWAFANIAFWGFFAIFM